MSENIVSLTDFKADASRLLKRLSNDSQPIVLTQNGRARAVVYGYDDYRRRQQSLMMLKLMVQGEADAQSNRTTPQHEIFDALRNRLPTD